MLLNPKDYERDMDCLGYDVGFAEARLKILNAVTLLSLIKDMPGLPEIDPIIQSLRDIAGKAIPDHETRKRTRQMAMGQQSVFGLNCNVISSGEDNP